MHTAPYHPRIECNEAESLNDYYIMLPTHISNSSSRLHCHLIKSTHATYVRLSCFFYTCSPNSVTTIRSMAFNQSYQKVKVVESVVGIKVVQK